MYSCVQARWRLLLFYAALTMFSGCASKPQPVASPQVDEVQTYAIPSMATNASPVETGFYRVKAGDTLTSIAKSFGRAPASVARWNNMSVTGVVSVGQLLRVAPPASTGSKPAASVKPGAVSGSLADATRFKWPVSGPVSEKFVSGKSTGVSFAGRAGDPIKAAQGGRVVYAGTRIKAYGRLIVIRHDGHFVTAYGNNRKLLVAEGAVVTQGQTIAEMGTDTHGNASLKFEVRKDGKPVDPLAYLPKRPG